MASYKKMLDQVADEVSRLKFGVDYLDVRLGESSGTVVNIRNKEVENVSRPRSFGGSARALFKGGWGFAAFSRLEEMRGAIEKAKAYAKLVAGERSELAGVSTVRDTVTTTPEQVDFLKVPLGEKVKLMLEYDACAWGASDEVVNVHLSYMDSLAWKCFVSSEGAVISQEKALVYSLVQVTARRGDVVQRYFSNLTDTNYTGVLGKHNEVVKTAQTAVQLVRAPQVKSGSYRVILDPVLAGVFAHEAFGHLSEADNVYENPQLASVMRIGRRFGSELITIYDDPSMEGFRGSYKYDDEGVLAVRALLLDRGVLVGRLHSRETAGKMDEKPNGHARASSTRAMPMVRMGITCIAPGKMEMKDMIGAVGDGLLCVDWQAGNTDHERFTFTAGYAREIKNGRLGGIVRDVKLTGNLFETLGKVDMVSKEVVVKGGNCGKMGQYVPESSSAPAVGILEVEVIGV